MIKYILVAFVAGCSSPHSHAPAGQVKDPVPMVENAAGKAELLAVEKAAFEKAKPVFDKWCAKCHSKDGKNASQKKLDHFDMTTYPFGGHHAMEISSEIRKSLGIGGGSPRMPADNKGAVRGEELELIKAWADAFDASHAGGAHEGHSGHGEHEH
jgi:uncharacterized membrane protein